MVDLDAEELDLVPGVDLAGAASKEGDDALQALVEFVEAVLPDLVEASLGNEVGDLEIIDAVNENGEAAVIHVAEAGFRVRRQAREPEPENIDGARLSRRWADKRPPARGHGGHRIRRSNRRGSRRGRQACRRGHR